MNETYPMSEEQCKICMNDWKRLNSGPLRPIKSNNIRTFDESAFKHGIHSTTTSKPKTRPDMICGLCKSMYVKYHEV